MNDFEYIYMKQRKDFGRYCQFDDVEPKILGAIERNDEIGESYSKLGICNAVLDNIPEMSEHTVNTARVQTKSRGMSHKEGGWPKEVDFSEAQDTSKWRKRLDKDPSFAHAVKGLCSNTSKILEENMMIDLFEDYFYDEGVEHVAENLSCKTTAVFKDPIEEKRAVSCISLHPDANKFVASYSVLRFQKASDDVPRMSFIWDLTQPNVPLTDLKTSSSIVSCQYQNKNPDLLVAGLYNGQINYYDLRKADPFVAASATECSHYDPVYDLTWLQSKTQSECVTASSDGQVLFWDVRNLTETVDSVELSYSKAGSDKKNTLGAVSLEWMQEAGPTKFLVGTEQGYVLGLAKKPKKNVEISHYFGLSDKGGFGAHHGPVYTVKRNPAHVKNFVTIGDWRAQIWMEELKGPLINTQYHQSMLRCGAWSPTRPGLLAVCRSEGWIDFWDYFYRMNEVALSHKVSDEALTTLSIQTQGALAAVGDNAGTVTLLELCDGLVNPGPNEKNVVGALFDREITREKFADAARKAQKGAGAHKQEVPQGPSVSAEDWTNREAAFMQELNIHADVSEYPVQLQS